MYKDSQPKCPCCKCKAPLIIGSIPPSNVFAGKYLNSLLPGGSLWKCPKCNLFFRYPLLSSELIGELYSEGAAGSWNEPVYKRFDWQLIYDFISNEPSINTLLDVGCYDGRFLSLFGPNYTKFGVEAHKEASLIAEKQGIQIVGHDFDDLPSQSVKVDAVFAIDVIEHTIDPLSFLSELQRLVKPDGHIIISTGNTSSLSWRFMGSRYWYCHIAEHISFINPQWITFACHKMGLTLLNTQKFSHGGGSLLQRLRELLLNVIYRFFPRIFSLIRQLGAGGVDISKYPELKNVPPYWLGANDHFLLILKNSR